eukprot:GHVU01025244.1.p1 GENE.GHVU01025244.1~~GHVU01025244.1.p1  ORF type:complete len:191 (+),score=45.12 GHVU01025244.1:245-817(+)
MDAISLTTNRRTGTTEGRRRSRRRMRGGGGGGAAAAADEGVEGVEGVSSSRHQSPPPAASVRPAVAESSMSKSPTASLPSTQQRGASRKRNLSELQPRGLYLRQRKHARYYLVGGGAGKRMETVQESLRAAAERREGRPPPRPLRPPIAPDSPLLAVSPFYPNQGGAIYVDGSNNAYNATLMLTNICSGA